MSTRFNIAVYKIEEHIELSYYHSNRTLYNYSTYRWKYHRNSFNNRHTVRFSNIIGDNKENR